MLSRRRFLTALAATPIVAAAHPLCAAALTGSPTNSLTFTGGSRALRFLHTHTGETLAVTPPLTIDENHIDEIVTKVGRAITHAMTTH